MSIQQILGARRPFKPDGLVRKGLDLAGAIWKAGDERALAQRTATLAFGIRVLSAAVAYFSQVLLARWMGSFEYGVFVLAWVWVLIIGGISTLGFDTAVLRFIPHYLERKDFPALRGLLLGSRVLVVAVSTLIALSGAGGIYLLGDLIANYYVLPLYLTLICYPLYTLTGIQDGIARSRNWIGVALVPPYLIRPLLILAFMALALLVGSPPDAASAAIAAIAATWISGLVQLFILEHRLAGEIPPGPRSYHHALWLKTAFPILLVDGFYVLLTNMDILVLSRFHTPDEVAVYFAALKTISLVAFVSFAVTAAATHRFAQYDAQGDKEKLSEFLRDVINWIFWPSLAVSALLLAAGYPLLRLFGPEFTGGYYLMFILVIGLLVRAARGPLEHLLNMLGHQNICARVLMFTLMLNLALNFLLIPWFDLAGAAWATTIAITAESILLYGIAKRRLGLHALVWRRAQG